MGGDWRRCFEPTWQPPDRERDEGPGLTWQLTGSWSGTWDSKIRGTVTRVGDR